MQSSKSPTAKSKFSIWDFDADGDVDVQDLALINKCFFRMVQFMFNVTAWTTPCGAVIGTTIGFVCTYVIIQNLRTCEAQVTHTNVELQALGVLPASITLHSILGIDWGKVESWFAFGIAIVLAANVLTVANGFYVGVRRARRRAREQAARLKGEESHATPAAPPPTSSLRKACCLLCGCGQFAQATFAVVGQVVLWIAVAICYVVSVCSLALLGVVALFRAYCERVHPFVSVGAAVSLPIANHSVHVAIDGVATLQTYNFEAYAAAVIATNGTAVMEFVTEQVDFGVAQVAEARATYLATIDAHLSSTYAVYADTSTAVGDVGDAALAAYQAALSGLVAIIATRIIELAYHLLRWVGHLLSTDLEQLPVQVRGALSSIARTVPIATGTIDTYFDSADEFVRTLAQAPTLLDFNVSTAVGRLRDDATAAAFELLEASGKTQYGPIAAALLAAATSQANQLINVVRDLIAPARAAYEGAVATANRTLTTARAAYDAALAEASSALMTAQATYEAAAAIAANANDATAATAATMSLLATQSLVAEWSANFTATWNEAQAAERAAVNAAFNAVESTNAALCNQTYAQVLAFASSFTVLAESTHTELMYAMSPLPDLIGWVGSQLGVAQEALAEVHEWLSHVANFELFLGRMCELTEPLPRALFSCLLASLLLLVGQIMVSKYHIVSAAALRSAPLHSPIRIHIIKTFAC